jgi:hypothetical protein
MKFLGLKIKIKTFCLSFGWVIWALIVAMLVLLFWFAFISEDGFNGFFSSDALYLPALYRDFFQDGYSLSGWTLNQASNIFPDMLLFFLLNAIFGNFIAATLGFSIIQYLAIIFLMYLIFKQLKPNFYSSTFAPAILLFASYLFLYFIDRCVWISSLLNHNSFHNSAFIIALVCIYLFLKYLNSKSWKTLIAVFVLSILSGACDKLFFIYFSVPVSLTTIILLFFSKNRKSFTKFLIAVAIGASFAIVLWIWFKNNPYFSLSTPYGAITSKYVRTSWETFSNQMYGYLTTFSFVFVLTWFSLLSYIAAAIHVSFKTYRIIKEKRHVDSMFIFQLFVLFFTPIVLLTPILAGSYDDAVSLRYSYFPYILLPFNSVVLASDFLNKNKLFRLLLNTVLSIFIVGYLLINYPIHEFGKGISQFFAFYPEKAKIVDHYFSDEKTFKYGITDDYWLARKVTMFSKKGVRLHSSFDGGDPWLHVQNKNWFTDNNKGKHAHCEFTFIIWSKEKEFPEIFRSMNDTILPIDIGNWNLYQVKPYRFIIPGPRFGVEPVLIEKPSEDIQTIPVAFDPYYHTTKKSENRVAVILK